jgi:hypothetical protein
LKLTDGWPDRQQAGLTAEIRHDVVEVPAKIAAGSCAFGADDLPGRIELASRLPLARRLLREVEVRLDVAHGLGLVDEATLVALGAEADDVRCLIDELIERLPTPLLEVAPVDDPFRLN